MKPLAGSTYSFLKGGGEMGELTRNYDWSKTPMGTPDQWPQSLQTTLSIILHSRFPMFLFWGPQHFCFYNDAYRPSLGNDGKHPHALGKPGAEIWPEIWEFIKPLIDNVISGKEASWHEDQLLPIYRNGKMEDVYWTFSYSPVTDESGSIAGVFVTCTETTEKVNNLSMLALSKEQLDMAIESAELATWDLDPQTNKFIASPRLKEWFGLQITDEVPLPLAINVIFEKDRGRVQKTIARAMEYDSGGNYEIEYGITHPGTGRERILKAKGQVHFNTENLPVRFAGAILDITAERKSTQALEESEIFSRDIFQNSPVAKIVFTGNDMVIRRVNERMLEMLGRDQSIIGKAFREVMPELRETQLLDRLRHVLASGEIFSLPEEKILLIKNGKPYEGYYNYTYKVLVNAAGEKYGVMCTASEVTEQVSVRKRLEESELLLERQVRERTEELAASVEALGMSNEELNRANHSLVRSNEDLAQYAYVASHDLQEPLRKIRMFADKLSNQTDLTDNSRPLVEKVAYSAERMSRLIKDLLEFSRLIKSDEIFSAVDMNEIATAVIDDFELLIEEKNVQVKMEKLPVIQGVGLQLNQLFFNLLSNAIKFTAADGQPMVNVSCKEMASADVKRYIHRPLISTKYYALSFIDNGIGFEQNYSEQIFEVFRRLHPKDVFPGSGIGLAICRRIAENHKGFLYAESQLGKGAAFHVILPEKQDAQS